MPQYLCGNPLRITGQIREVVVDEREIKCIKDGVVAGEDGYITIMLYIKPI